MRMQNYLLQNLENKYKGGCEVPETAHTCLLSVRLLQAGSFANSNGLVCSFCPVTSTKVEPATTCCLNSAPTKDAVLPKTEDFVVRHRDFQQ